MALTKVTGQVIKNTTDVTVGVLTVTNTLAVGGTVSIGGTLTYEDVTNVDAVGLITARNGIVVGSGITLSKDGDGFFTGVVTATSYAGSGANLTGIDTDLVSDTSPQLGGNLDVNTKNIVFGDSGGATDDRLTFGAGTDLSIYHDGSHSRMVDSGTGNLILQTSKININNADGTEAIIHGTAGGAVEIYHANSVKITTSSTGVSITGQLDLSSHLDMGDSDIVKLGDSDDLQLYHDTNNSIIANSTGELLIDSSIISLRDASNNSRLRIEPAGNINIAKNLNVVGITTVNFSASGAALKIERGSATEEAIDINTTSTSSATRIRINESGTYKAQFAYSHDNDQVEIIGGSGQKAVIITDNNKTSFKIDTNGYITKPLNVIFHAFGGGTDIAANTDIVFGQERFDIGSNYNTSTGEFTAPITGYYHFYAQVYRQNASNDSWWGFYLDNGSGYSQISESRMKTDGAAGYSTLQSSIYWYASSGHKIKCRVGTAGNIHCNNTLSYFCGNLVG